MSIIVLSFNVVSNKKKYIAAVYMKCCTVEPLFIFFSKLVEILQDTNFFLDTDKVTMDFLQHSH